MSNHRITLSIATEQRAAWRVAAGVALALVLGLLPASAAFAAGEAPVLTPGAGWTEPTAQPPAAGDSQARGYDCVAIARFDVVPWQTFDGRFGVGVVAFHLNGIDRVEFSVDNGPWTAVREMTLNPRTGVWEYWADLDAASFADDEAVVVRAIAYPTTGVPRVLQEDCGHLLTLYANGGGTLPNTGASVHVSAATGDDEAGDGSPENPFATWARGFKHLNTVNGRCEGATIYLHEGTYTYSDDTGGDGAYSRWVTTAAAPGCAREDVVLSGAGSGVLQHKMHLQGLTINHSLGNAVVLRRRSSPYGNQFWLDGCDIYGIGYVGDVVSEGFTTGSSFTTDCSWHDHKAGLGGGILRNVEAWNLGGDFLAARSLMVNCRVDHMRHNAPVHADVYQVYAGQNENIIIYNLMATDVESQGINIGQGAEYTNNVAIVNCLIEQIPGAPTRNFLPATTNDGPSKHIVLWHHTIINMKSVDDHCNQQDLDARGCAFSAFGYDASEDISGWLFDQNHFTYASQALGGNFTTGNHQWVAEASWSGDVQLTPGDYRPAASSPLAGRMQTLLTPVDVLNRPRRAPTAVGAMIAEGEDLPAPLPGDANGDGHVNVQDFIILKRNYNTTSGASFDMGDFNGDGAVNVADFVILKRNYNT